MKNLIYEWIIFQEDEIILVREKQMAESKHLSNIHNIPKDPQERIDWARTASWGWLSAEQHRNSRQEKERDYFRLSQS